MPVDLWFTTVSRLFLHRYDSVCKSSPSQTRSMLALLAQSDKADVDVLQFFRVLNIKRLGGESEKQIAGGKRVVSLCRVQNPSSACYKVDAVTRRVDKRLLEVCLFFINKIQIRRSHRRTISLCTAPLHFRFVYCSINKLRNQSKKWKKIRNK